MGGREGGGAERASQEGGIHRRDPTHGHRRSLVLSQKLFEVAGHGRPLGAFSARGPGLQDCPGTWRLPVHLVMHRGHHFF